MATTAPSIDRARVASLTEDLKRKLIERTPESAAWFDRARAVMPKGVPSSFQVQNPRPVYISHGEGAKLWDVDRHEHVDFHNGFGVIGAGHGSPAIVRAVAEQAARGSHFAAPTEGSVAVAEE